MSHVQAAYQKQRKAARALSDVTFESSRWSDPAASSSQCMPLHALASSCTPVCSLWRWHQTIGCSSREAACFTPAAYTDTKQDELSPWLPASTFTPWQRHLWAAATMADGPCTRSCLPIAPCPTCLRRSRCLQNQQVSVHLVFLRFTCTLCTIHLPTLLPVCQYASVLIRSQFSRPRRHQPLLHSTASAAGNASIRRQPLLLETRHHHDIRPFIDQPLRFR